MINVKVEELSPFQQLTRKLQMKKKDISKKEIIASYFEEIKKDLIRNFEVEMPDDVSMASIGNTTDEETYMAGEAQGSQHEQISLEEIKEFLTKIKEGVEESSAPQNNKGKEKFSDT